jgi:hypothetical protein
VEGGSDLRCGTYTAAAQTSRGAIAFARRSETKDVFGCADYERPFAFPANGLFSIRCRRGTYAALAEPFAAASRSTPRSKGVSFGHSPKTWLAAPSVATRAAVLPFRSTKPLLLLPVLIWAGAVFFVPGLCPCSRARARMPQTRPSGPRQTLGTRTRIAGFAPTRTVDIQMFDVHVRLCAGHSVQSARSGRLIGPPALLCPRASLRCGGRSRAVL